MRHLAFFVIFAGCTLAAELSLSVGAGPSSSTLTTSSGTFTGTGSTATILADGAKKIIGIGPATLLLDLPVGIGGPAHAELGATSSGGVAAYSQRMQFAATPGVKVRVGLGLLSPWVSFGGGFARLHELSAGFPVSATPTTQEGSRWSAAVSPAGGVDVRPLPYIFFRGEVRTFLLRQPDQVFSGLSALKGSWQNNLVFLAGVGVRF